MASALSSTLKDMFVKGTYALGAGILSAWVIDFFHIPGLDEAGMFGNSHKTNYEIVVYAISAAGSAAGIMDYFSGSKPLGFSKEFAPYFLGFGTGTAFYDHIIKSHFKGINIYKDIYNIVPNVPLL